MQNRDSMGSAELGVHVWRALKTFFSSPTPQPNKPPQKPVPAEVKKPIAEIKKTAANSARTTSSVELQASSAAAPPTHTK